jgi:hypothetical protein
MAGSLGQRMRALRRISEHGDRPEEHHRYCRIPYEPDRTHSVLEVGKALDHGKGSGLVRSSLGAIQHLIRGDDPAELGRLDLPSAFHILAMHGLEELGRASRDGALVRFSRTGATAGTSLRDAGGGHRGEQESKSDRL